MFFATLSKNKAIVVYKCILLMSFNIQACFDLYLDKWTSVLCVRLLECDSTCRGGGGGSSGFAGGRVAVDVHGLPISRCSLNKWSFPLHVVSRVEHLDKISLPSSSTSISPHEHPHVSANYLVLSLE